MQELRALIRPDYICPKTPTCFILTNRESGEQTKTELARIKWHDDFETESRFIYYGTGTRDEYRLTRFGREFPFLNDDNVGDLLVLCKMNAEEYKGYVLSNDEDIDNFLDAFGLSPLETNRLIKAEPGLLGGIALADQAAAASIVLQICCEAGQKLSANG